MKEHTRTQILMAAREIVARKGFDCSIREIATKSDISYGHVHRSWDSKEALLEDAERMLIEELEAALGKPVHTRQLTFCW